MLDRIDITLTLVKDAYVDQETLTTKKETGMKKDPRIFFFHKGEMKVEKFYPNQANFEIRFHPHQYQSVPFN